VAFDKVFNLECRPDSIAVNCDGTRVSVMDASAGGVFTVFDLTVSDVRFPFNIPAPNTTSTAAKRDPFLAATPHFHPLARGTHGHIHAHTYTHANALKPLIF
jgi:hypothetical protein